jgi:hypothetical protein
MIKNRFWSIFSKLSDNDINDEIKIYDNLNDVLTFDDTLLFLVVTNNISTEKHQKTYCCPNKCCIM